LPLPWGDREEWNVERQRALDAAARPASISATALAGTIDPLPVALAVADHDAGLAKEPVDLDLPPWRRGRYGSAIGRAVHAVLQFCDLADGHDIDALAAAQCASEGVEGMESTVAGLARSAIAAPIVRHALTVAHHRELFVAAPVAERVLEGYIDLFVESHDGGVIVDYKTDQWADAHQRQQAVAKYRMQLAAYAVALELVTGRAPTGGVLVRCRADGPAEQIELPDWPAAVAAARGALSA